MVMLNVKQITKKLKNLPPDKLVIISEFIDFIGQKTKDSLQISEMNDAEVLIAAERTGSFEFLNDSSENIYTLDDGEPL